MLHAVNLPKLFPNLDIEMNETMRYTVYPIKRTMSKLQRHDAPGLHTTILTRGDIEEIFITATPRNGDSFLRMFSDIHHVVRDAGATLVTADIFGIPALTESAHRDLHAAWGNPDCPVTWLTAGPTADQHLTGVQVHAIRGTEVRRIRHDGRVIGSIFEDEYARHCYLGDLVATTNLPRGDQARRIYEQIETALRDAGMTFDNVIRTWLYCDHILDWYDELNKVRNQFYTERGVFKKLVPASTGIGSGNDAHTAMIADAYAIASRHPEAKIFAVPSPLQCPALEYGSSFSRAVEVDLPDHRTLWVSGTASIEPGGKTAHPGDIDGQIQLTMDVAGAILESRGMKWNDVTRAVAYVKHAADAPAFDRFRKANGLEAMPTVVTENDVCRDDLLFEIELDAVTV